MDDRQLVLAAVHARCLEPPIPPRLDPSRFRKRHRPVSARERFRLLMRSRPAVSRRRVATDHELAAEAARVVGKLRANFRKRTGRVTLLVLEGYRDSRQTPPQCTLEVREVRSAREVASSARRRSVSSGTLLAMPAGSLEKRIEKVCRLRARNAPAQLSR